MSMADTQAARALASLRSAISTASEAAAKAERELAHATDPGHAAQAVMHALAWGHSNAMSGVETALAAIEDMHKIRTLELAAAAPTAAWFLVTRSGEALNPQHGAPTEDDRTSAKRDGARIVLLGSKGGAS